MLMALDVAGATDGDCVAPGGCCVLIPDEEAACVVFAGLVAVAAAGTTLGIYVATF